MYLLLHYFTSLAKTFIFLSHNAFITTQNWQTHNVLSFRNLTPQGFIIKTKDKTPALSQEVLNFTHLCF